LPVDVRFLCRPEFIAACSAAEIAFKFQLEYVPKGSYLTAEGGETIEFRGSVWICHTASSKGKVDKPKPAMFTPVAVDEMSIASTMPDTTTVL